MLREHTIGMCALVCCIRDSDVECRTMVVQYEDSPAVPCTVLRYEMLMVRI